MPLVPVEPAEGRAAPVLGAPSSMAPRGRRLVVAALLLIATASACAGDTVTDRPAAASFEARSFAVYALSRGKGVPPEAREALRRVDELVDGDRRRGIGVRTRRTRVGLEGETRLCVEYACAADARRALEQVEKIVEDVDLVNLVRGPCKGPDEEEDKP